MVTKEKIYVFFLLICGVAHGSTLGWDDSRFFLHARQMKLADVLQNLAGNYDTPVSIDPEIKDSFSGIIDTQSAVKTLNDLISQYNLIYYFDGAILYIYPGSRIDYKVITFNTLNATSFIHYLRDQKVLMDKSCKVNTISGVNALDIGGVPACMSRITQLATMLDSEVTKNRDNAVSIAVYPLKYATAMDEQYQYRDQTVVVPGVVSVLRDMNNGANSSVAATTGGASVAASQALPSFSADPRQNAVIVRDHSANMDGYKKLIHELDQRPQMIEISVAIIDVDAGDINQLGIDWSASVSLGGGTFSFNNTGGAGSGGFSTVISNTSDFMVRLSALEKNSHAYVLSQPSVVTLNNIQAVLDKNITFYTKLESEKVAKLESVTTGSLLRVTPRLLKDNGKQKIMLNLNIQDGQQNTPVSKDAPLPVIQNSEIASQATLLAGESLLLGGFKQEKQLDTKTKIPLFGDIPILGSLFTNTTNETQNVIRLFLIKASVASQ